MIPVIIDTDPGIDDAIALMLAAVSDEIELLGITTVAGNVGIVTTTANALALKSLLGVAAPIGRGAHRTMAANLAVSAAHVHGADGLGGWSFAELAAAKTADIDLLPSAQELLSRLLRESAVKGRKATIVAIGPLTNIAQLLVADRHAASLIAEIVIMGGGMADRLGNITPRAEFNIFTDPEAAAIVFNAQIPLRMVGLNVTEIATLGRRHLGKLFEIGGVVASGVQKMLGSYNDSPDLPGETAQHDSLALAAVIRPELLTFETAQVNIEVAPGVDRGMTRVSLAPAAASVVQVATAVNVPDFRDFMTDRLTKLAQKLPAGN